MRHNATHGVLPVIPLMINTGLFPKRVVAIFFGLVEELEMYGAYCKSIRTAMFSANRTKIWLVSILMTAVSTIMVPSTATAQGPDEDAELPPVAPNVLSLQWDSAKPPNEITLTQFPLSLSEKGKWFIWRGSRSNPVLVFDPKLTGKIESGEQLIGATFRGKRFDNGFDALASLDNDQDGKVSGPELKNVSLWFDDGSDGIVNPGELRTAVEMDLVALYFNNYQLTAKGDLRLEFGFDRSVAGVKIHGPSLAWRSKAFSNNDVPSSELRLSPKPSK